MSVSVFEEVLVWNISPANWPMEYWLMDSAKQDKWRKEHNIKLVTVLVKKSRNEMEK